MVRKWIEPKSAVQADALKKEGLQSAVFNVCWKCEGGYQAQTLYRIGKENGQTIYSCAKHRGLLGQVA